MVENWTEQKKLQEKNATLALYFSGWCSVARVANKISVQFKKKKEKSDDFDGWNSRIFFSSRRRWIQKFSKHDAYDCTGAHALCRAVRGNSERFLYQDDDDCVRVRQKQLQMRSKQANLGDGQRNKTMKWINGRKLHITNHQGNGDSTSGGTGASGPVEN